MAGTGGGYLSQVVRDARPRAAPSLYAGTPAARAIPADAPTYARLMDGDADASADAREPMDTPGSAMGDIDSARSGSERPSELEQTQPDMPARDETEALGPRPPTRVAIQRVPPPITTRTAPAPGPSGPHETAPDDAAEASLPGVEAGAAPQQAGPEEAPAIAPRVRVSATVPRPASFDVVADAAAPAEASADPGDGPPDAPDRAPGEPGVRDAAPPSRATPPSRIRTADLLRSRQTAPAAGPDARPDRHRDLQDPAAAKGPPEVHIGQVEVIVQDTPPPRAAPAPRVAPKPPSPARYHIRRF